LLKTYALKHLRCRIAKALHTETPSVFQPLTLTLSLKGRGNETERIFSPLPLREREGPVALAMGG